MKNQNEDETRNVLIYNLITVYNVSDLLALWWSGLWQLPLYHHVMINEIFGCLPHVMVFSFYALRYIFSPPPLCPPIYSFSNHRVISFFRRWHSVTFLLPSSLSFSLFAFYDAKKYDMFFLCGRTIASIDKNTKCINYRTNLLVLFYEERNFTTYLEKIEKISRRHFVVDINIDFCIFTHRLELSLFIPVTRRFFFC